MHPHFRRRCKSNMIIWRHTCLHQSPHHVMLTACLCSEMSPRNVIRIEGIVKLLRERMPNTRILLMGILPRHKMNFRGRLDWPMFYTEVSWLRAPPYIW